MKPHSARTIPLFDIGNQNRPLSKQIQKAAISVLDSHEFILGPQGRLFEKGFGRLQGAGHCVGTASGTDALKIAIQALGIGPGDDVITTPLTFIATAIAVLSTGARVVLADIDPKTLTLDPQQVEKKITSKTKGILPVHLYGLPAEMDSLVGLAKAHRLKIVEDCAQAHLAEYKGKKVGTWGDLGAFSFYPSKNLGACGDAGAVVTGDAALAEKSRLLRNNGSSPRRRYEHVLFGQNARLDEIQAAILRVKLKRLPGWTEARRRHAALYGEFLRGLPIRFQEEGSDRKHAYHLFVIRTPRRDSLAEYLRFKGIQTGVYYPIPVHLQPAYRFLGYRNGDFPESEKACSEALALPVYPELKTRQIRFISEQIRRFFR